MIRIANLHVFDEKAYGLCSAHIHDCILSGINFYIDTYDDTDRTKYEFNNDEDFAYLFPKAFAGDRMASLYRIRDLIKSEEEVELSSSDKYILMHCLRDYYEDYYVEYSLEIAAKALVSDTRSDDNIGLNIQPIENIENRFYVMSKIAAAAHSICCEEQMEDESLDEVIEMYMSDVEDVSRYADVCFDDCDYELLGKYSNEELRGSALDKMLGLDV